MQELSTAELAVQSGQLLPAREALALANFANVLASNASLALNAVTADSVAASAALQAVDVSQY